MAAVPLLLVIVALTFLLIRLAPGDPAYILAGDAPSPQFLTLIRSKYGLDRPVLEQLGIYVWRVLHFDLGTSIYFQRSVFDLVLERAPATLLLTSTAMFAATVLGVYWALGSLACG